MLFSPLLGKDFQFDQSFSDGLKPPASGSLVHLILRSPVELDSFMLRVDNSSQVVIAGTSEPSTLALLGLLVLVLVIFFFDFHVEPRT